MAHCERPSPISSTASISFQPEIRFVSSTSRTVVTASLVGAFQLSFLCLLTLFCISSETDNKYFLLSLPASQIALRVANEEPDDTTGLSEGEER